jgi:cell wall hydrolase
MSVLRPVSPLGRVSTAVSSLVLAAGMTFISATSTITEYAEALSLAAELGLAQNRTSDNSRQLSSALSGNGALSQASLVTGNNFYFANYEIKGDRQPILASYEDITGSLPKPQLLDQPSISYPRVNRTAKEDRLVPISTESTYARLNPGFGAMDGLGQFYFGDPETIFGEIPQQFALPQGWANGRLAERPEDLVNSPRQNASFRERDHACLAQAVYFEARGEPAEGQLAVAQVVMNRVASEYYPNNVCDVVYQNQNRRNRCQFSFACDGRPERIEDQESWGVATTIARQVLTGEVMSEAVGIQATHYHASYVRPNWIRDMVKIRQIGAHIFYRVRAWT